MQDVSTQDLQGANEPLCVLEHRWGERGVCTIFCNARAEGVLCHREEKSTCLFLSDTRALRYTVI